MIFRQEGFQVLGTFPSAFSYPAEPHDSPTLRSEPLLTEQLPREIQREHALSDIRPVPRAGDEGLRECIPDGQKRREFPLERRFRADVVSRLNSPSRFRNSTSSSTSRVATASPTATTCSPSSCTTNPRASQIRLRHMRAPFAPRGSPDIPFHASPLMNGKDQHSGST